MESEGDMQEQVGKGDETCKHEPYLHHQSGIVGPTSRRSVRRLCCTRIRFGLFQLSARLIYQFTLPACLQPQVSTSYASFPHLNQAHNLTT